MFKFILLCATKFVIACQISSTDKQIWNCTRDRNQKVRRANYKGSALWKGHRHVPGSSLTAGANFGVRTRPLMALTRKDAVSGRWSRVELTLRMQFLSPSSLCEFFYTACGSISYMASHHTIILKTGNLATKIVLRNKLEEWEKYR
jgi:hypothetical protein